MSGRSGIYLTSTTTGEEVQAFVPDPLPPEPEIQLTSSDYELMERANRWAGSMG